MPTADNDTLYTSTVFDQRYVPTMPDTHDRHDVVDVFSQWPLPQVDPVP
jgi:hypothetical protein